MIINQNLSAINYTRSAAPKAAAAAASAEPAGPSESSSFTQLPARIASLNPTAVAAVAKEFQGHEFVDGELLVKVKPGMDFSLMGDFASEYGATVVEKFDIPQNIYKAFDGDLLRLKLPAGITLAEAVTAMRADARVAYAEPNDVIRLDPQEGQQPPSQNPPQQPPAQPGVPNDLNPQLWGINNTGQTGGTAGADVHAMDAWKVTTGSRENGPLIAVIDTGADYNHPDLAANIWTNPGEIAGDGIDNDGNGVIDDVHGYNAYANTGDPLDGHSHGSHCSGTIAGVGNNGQGVVGVNWEARVMPVKIFSDSGSTSADAIVRGILYATAQGADITSNSWGGGRPNDAIRDAFANSPAIHLCAAGNNGSNTDRGPFYPMGYDLPNIVSVAATDHNDNRASFSNYGTVTVDVAAPGKDILSTVPNNGYASYSGTSMATPHVSGVVGLMKSAHPEWTNAQIKDRLIYSSDKKAQLSTVSASGGRVNAARALEDDNVAPAAPNDFAGSEASTRGVTLSWTATGDDGWCNGPAAAFDLRVSDAAINADSFDEASPIATNGPTATGNIESLRYDLAPSLEPRQLHFAMKSIDNVGNRSELRSATVTIPAATLAFGDAFDGEESAWSADANWGRVDVEGRGKVWTDSPEGEYQNGTNTALTSPTFSLANTTNNLMTFDAKTDFAWGDNAMVEITEDGGQNWTSLKTLPRTSDWGEQSIDLSAFDGKEVQLRFRVETNERTSRDGLLLDNLKVFGDA